MDEFEITIDKMVPGGLGFGNGAKKAVFVPFSAPGDHLLVEVEKQHKNHCFAAIKKIITPAASRVQPKCAVYGQCGGCQLSHISSLHQEQIKSSFISDSLQRIGKIEPDGVVADLKAAPADIGYRRRAGLKVRVLKNVVLLGFFASGSHRVVDISTCPILDHRLERLLAPLRHLLEALGGNSFIPEVDCIAGDAGVGMVFHTIRAFSASDQDRLRAFAKEQQISQLWMQQGKKSRLRSLFSTSLLNYEVGGFSLSFKPGDFIQVNGFGNQILVDEVVAASSGNSSNVGEVAWDLFCGIGNFTLPISTRFNKVYGVEGSPRAMQRLVENSKRNKTENIRQLRADLFKPFGLDSLDGLERADMVLLDPPRNGAFDLVKRVAKKPPKRIVYVSCDPGTFSRDAAVLVEAGMTLKSVLPLDMFPHTRHVELIGVFDL
ncbi:MAG: 23S rRNA (uracil(1939)-C(5))-methyltransferase RlmD [Magnetococcales bacterium]|nr:23S rRNA (uracil(1939)-C(5))-methyltransferase RlmD [Magnetococcales bacterium]